MYYIKTALGKTEFEDLSEAIKALLKMEHEHEFVGLYEYAWTKKFVDIVMVEFDHVNKSYLVIGDGGFLVETSYDNLMALLSRVYKADESILV